MNEDLKKYTKQWLLPILSYYLRLCQEGLRKTKKNLSQDNQFLTQDWTPELPTYEAGMLTTQARHSVKRK
jgi:hypothetical protein